jgi:hypothetical protein
VTLLIYTTVFAVGGLAGALLTEKGPRSALQLKSRTYSRIAYGTPVEKEEK